MIIVSFILSIIIAFLIATPWITDQPEGQTSISSVRDLEVKKEHLLQALKDLELDYATKKIAEEDFKNQKNILTQELSVLYSTLDSLLGAPESH